MAGWSAIDTSGRIFRDYSVSARLTTIVVDKRGRIAAILDPETLKAGDLTALVAEKTVRFEAVAAPIPNRLSPSDAGSESTPLFEISLRNSAPNTKSGYTESGGVFVMRGQTPLALLMYAYAAAEDRIVEVSPLSQNRYNVEALFAGADEATRKLALQAAVISGLHLQVTPKIMSRKVYVLRSTSQSQTLLVPTASTGGRMSGYSKGEEKIELIRASMDDLASSLEAALRQPVLNESEVPGRFDGELRIAFGDGAAAKKELAAVMGLDLREEERSVPMFEVQSSSQPARITSARSPEK